MKTFLMCEPHFFGVTYSINPWMNDNIGLVNNELAATQYANLVSTIYKLGAAAIFMDPSPNQPDQVFTANAGLVIEDRWGAKKAIVSKFKNPERQGEEPAFAQAFTHLGYPIIEFPDDLIFEGAGDALFATQHLLFIGHGFRSDPRFATWAETELKKYEVQVVSLQLTNPNYYHLDTCFCPLDGGHILVNPNAMTPESIDKLRKLYSGDLIFADDYTAEKFGCNAISIGSDIIVNDVSSAVENVLNDNGYKIHRVDLTEFMKAGGSAKCLTLEI